MYHITLTSNKFIVVNLGKVIICIAAEWICRMAVNRSTVSGIVDPSGKLPGKTGRVLQT